MKQKMTTLCESEALIIYVTKNKKYYISFMSRDVTHPRALLTGISFYICNVMLINFFLLLTYTKHGRVIILSLYI